MCVPLATERGEVPDLDRVYLPIGSCCTITGLILGVALARHARLKAFASQRFTICGAVVHEAVAWLSRVANVHYNFTALPFTIRYTLRLACRTLKEAGGPDVLVSAEDVLKNHVAIDDRAEMVGAYGAHSRLSRVAADQYDRSGGVVDGAGGKAPHLWICGHFVAKTFVGLLEGVEADPSLNVLLWQTKSATQPHGTEEALPKLVAMPRAMREWADTGYMTSSLRPGVVSCKSGAPVEYRDMMTDVVLKEGRYTTKA